VGGQNEDGEWISISEVKRIADNKKKNEELEQPPAPQSSPQQPADTDPGPDPGGIMVDEFFVETKGREHLPNKDAAADYRKAAEGVFARLAGAVIDRSGVDVGVFAKTVGDLVKQVAEAERSSTPSLSRRKCRL
jgi:hypothetical protein